MPCTRFKTEETIQKLQEAEVLPFSWVTVNCCGLRGFDSGGGFFG